MEEKESLVKKLARKLADFTHALGRSKIVKGIATTALAAGLATAAAGCQIHIENDPPIDQTQEGGNKEDLNNQGNQQGNQNQQGGSTTPTTPTKPDYSQYSQLLQDVLKSDYYNGLIAKYKAGQLDPGTIKTGFNVLCSIPFNFLKNAGEDVEEIINNNIEVGRNTFVKTKNKNELYSYTFILKNQSSDDAYRTMYLLKYNISDEEYRDYVMLTNREYYQATFLFQEIDKTREPELVTKFDINEEDYKTLINNINRDGLISENEVTNVFLHPSTMEQIDAPDGDKKFEIKLDYLTKRKNGYEFGSANVRFPWGCRYNNEIFTFVDSSIAKVLENSEPEDISYFNYAFVNNLIKNQ